MTTTQPEMLTALSRQLDGEGIPHDARDLAQWLSAAWAHVEENPQDVRRWAEEFRQQLQGVGS